MNWRAKAPKPFAAFSSCSVRRRCLEAAWSAITSRPWARWRWISDARARAPASVSGAPRTGVPACSTPETSTGPSVSFAGLPLGLRNRRANDRWPEESLRTLSETAHIDEAEHLRGREHDTVIHRAGTDAPV